MATLTAGAATAQVRAARDFLLNHREDYATAYRDYRPPALEEFNWALNWFDAIAADGGDRPALWIVEPDGGETRRTFAELSACSNQVANWLRASMASPAVTGSSSCSATRSSCGRRSWPR